MNLTERINKIIQYPTGTDNIDTTIFRRPSFTADSEKFIPGAAEAKNWLVSIAGAVNDLTVNWWLRGEFSFENDYLYSTEVKPQGITYTTELTTAKVWKDSTEIAPLEGYYLGYRNNLPIANFASLLNTSEFINSLYFALTYEDTWRWEAPYFVFLNTLPINPPYPIEAPTSDATALGTRDVFEENPGMIFKSVGGIYSIPEFYAHWLGGLWSWRDYIGDSSFSHSIINIDGKQDSGYTGIWYDIDSDGLDNNFFEIKTFSDGVPTIAVKIDEFKKVPNVDESTGNYGIIYRKTDDQSVIMAVDSLVGIGHYRDLFDKLYFNWYGTSLLGVKGIRELNVDYNKNTADQKYYALRTFPTYAYDMSATHQLRTFATYSIISYKNTAGTGLSDLATILKSSAYGIPITPFDMYQSIWKYLHYRLTNDTKAIYDDVAKEVEQYYVSQGGTENAQQLQDAIDGIFTALDNGSVYPTLIKNLADYPILDLDSFNKKNNLFADGISQLRFLIDYIGSEVLRFINSDVLPRVSDDFKELYQLNDNSDDYIFALYPSAGGVAALQYVGNSLGGMNKLMITDATTKMQSNVISQQFINFVANGCRMLWYTGPFLGDAPFRSNQVNLTNDGFNLFESKLYSSNLNKQMLFNKAEFTNPFNTAVSSDNPNLCSLIRKQARTYIMDADFKKRDYVKKANVLSTVPDTTYDPVIYYDDIIDYIGLEHLDNFSYDFEKKDKVKELILSLLIVDKGDFSSLTITGKTSNGDTMAKTYSVQEQLDLLLIYNATHSNSYLNGEVWEAPAQNMLQVMNAALTQAQYNKVKRVVGAYTQKRILYNAGSVFNYPHIDDGKVENKFSSIVFQDQDALSKLSDGAYLRACIYGTQTMKPWSGDNYQVHDDILKYLGRYCGLTGKMYYPTTNNQTPSILSFSTYQNRLYTVVDYFFQGIDVQLTKDNMLVALDFLLQYISMFDIQSQVPTVAKSTPNLKKLREVVAGWVGTAANDFKFCTSSIKTEITNLQTMLVQNKIDQVANKQKTDVNILKAKTYYNIKAIYDNWMQVSTTDNGKVSIAYNHNQIDPDSSGDTSLADHFMFVDRSMRDIGDELLVNIDWLTNYLNNNLAVVTDSNNVSIYSFLSKLAQQHASVIHALPAFVNLGTQKGAYGSTNFAGDLFNTYDYVDVMESTPKFIFQYLGNVNSVLNTPQNRAVRSSAKSYSLLGNVSNVSKNNSMANIADGTAIPEDLRADGANGFAFVVNFGAQEQNMFSNLIVDQNEFQNTEEYYRLITSLSDRSETQSTDLFAIYTERSYTATVDSLGNLMIQPLMFFEIVNTPLFYGTYWITNVKHTITPNDIKTTFKGMRQPMAVLPSKGDVLLQLAKYNISNVLGTAVLPSSLNVEPVIPTSVTQLTSQEKKANQLAVKNFLKMQKGITPLIAAGIMGNIYAESAFNPTIRSKTERLKSGQLVYNYGLIQWNSGSYDLSQVGSTVDAQMAFLLDITKTPSVSEYLKAAVAAENEGKDAAYMAYLFALKVERCYKCIGTYADYKVGGNYTYADGTTVNINPYNVRSVPALEFFLRFKDPNDALYWA